MSSRPKPSSEQVESARAAFRTLRPLASAASAPRLLSTRATDGEEVSVPLPEEAFQLLLEVLRQLAEGDTVSVVSTHAELSSQQAADLLQVSRPFLIALLENGEIPFRKVGKHRRVRLSDLLAFKEKDDAQRRGALDALTAEAQELDLGY